MTDGLKISKSLTLPLDAVTQKFGDMGRTGSGKTYGATKRAEEMLDAGAQIIALDPVGVWYGLRVGADGNAGYSIPVFGGLHGDVPLASTAGPIIADLIVDRGISCVLDVSQFETNTEKARFAMQFADRFFFRKKAAPSAVHLFLEECQEFCVPPDTEVMTPAGWRQIADVSAGDMVVAYDPASGAFANERVSAAIQKAFVGSLVHLKTTSLDCAVTPDHRVVMRRFQHDPTRYRLYPWTFCRAADLPRDFQVPSGGAPEGSGVDLPDDMLRVIGWMITDGYYHQRSRGKVLALQQSTATTKMGRNIVDEMRAVLKRLGARAAYERPAKTSQIAGRSAVGKASVQFYLGGPLSAALNEWLGDDLHRIPRRLLAHCTHAQLSVLYEGLLEGDGTAKAGRWSRFYAGLSESLADDFQEIATRLGVRTVKKRVPQNGQWVVMISEVTQHWVRHRGRTVDYDGSVFCLTVPSGAFVARRNGTVFVTGNCPQNAQPGEQHMLGVFERLIKLGRNFGIGVSLISQRPQEVNKKALEQVECLLAYQMTGTRSRKAIEDWASSHDLNEDLGEILPTLPVGEPFIYSPQWLRISKRIKIARKKTADVSATPTVGAAVRAERSLAPVDLEQLQQAIAASVEQAKADDPKELQKRIRELEGQIARTPSAHDIAQDSDLDYERGRREGYDEAFEDGRRSAIDDTRIEERRAVAAFMERIKDQLGEVEHILDTTFAPAMAQLRALVLEHHEEHQLLPDPAPRAPIAPARATKPPARATPAPIRAPKLPSGETNGALVAPARKVLTTVAQLERIGIAKPTVIQVALFNGVSHTTGSFKQYIRDLTGDGHLIRENGRVSLTGHGRSSADDVEAPRRHELLEFWCNKLTSPQSAKLKLIAAAPSISREALAAKLGVSPTTGSFKQDLRDMRTYGLIDFKAGEIVLTDLLFPKGLR